MRKIPTIFKRNPDSMKDLLNEHHPACEWVFSGEGTLTRKYDGTCCMIKDGRLFKRREVKKGKPDPLDFILADHDKITGKRVGWVPLVKGRKDDRWYWEAFREAMDRNSGIVPDATYELVGPKIQGNPEGYTSHVLIAHAGLSTELFIPDFELTMSGIKTALQDLAVEGFVWHHPDGRMAKIKKRDFGLSRSKT